MDPTRYAVFEATLARGELSKAQALAEMLVQQHPDDERSHVALARVVSGMGQPVQAAEYLERALAAGIDGSHVMAHLASLRLASGDTARALELANLVVKLGTPEPAAFHVLGTHALAKRDPKAAIPWFRKALAADPRHVESWCGLATALKKSGGYLEAVQALQNALANRPKDAELHLQMVRTALESGDGELARGKLLEAMDVFPHHPQLLQLAHQVRQQATATSESLAGEIAKVRTLLNAGDRPGAQALLTTLLGKHRPTRALRFIQAEVNAAVPKADVTTLITEVHRLAKQYPEAWEPRALLGSLLSRRSPLQSPKQAMTYAEEAWHLSGGNPQAGQALLKAYQAAGRTLQAQALEAQLNALTAVARPGPA